MDDYLAISNIIFSYAERLDAGDSDGIGELFSHGEFSSETQGGPYRGRDEVAAHYRSKARVYDDGLPGQKHVTTNLQMEIADDGLSATCRSVFTTFEEVPGTKKILTIAVGRYHDRFAKIDREWHIASRHLIRDLTGEGF